MSDPLSIRAAADEAPDAIALSGAGRAYSFAALAVRAEAAMRGIDRARFDTVEAGR